MLNHKGTQELITPRLRLRKYVLSDAEDMYKNYAADARVARFLTWEAYTNIEDIRTFLQETMNGYSSNIYHWAIEIESSMVGGISVVSLDEKNRSCEIGYCIGYDYWNKGITTEALRAIMAFLFNDVGIHRIMAKHDIDNPASGKVMKNCNMTLEGRLREHYIRHDGTYADSLVYGILRNEFKEND